MPPDASTRCPPKKWEHDIIFSEALESIAAPRPPPLIAALHPVNAVLMIVLSFLLIRRATDLVRQEREAGAAATAVDG